LFGLLQLVFVFWAVLNVWKRDKRNLMISFCLLIFLMAAHLVNNTGIYFNWFTFNLFSMEECTLTIIANLIFYIVAIIGTWFLTKN
jgi:hypothetical protein